MNRAETLDVLKSINILRTTVNGDFSGIGFFFEDAAKALGDFDRACRHIAALTKAGKVNCTRVQLGFSTHDFYYVV